MLKSIKSKLIRLAIVIAAVALSVFLTGCAELSVYDYSDGEHRYNVYELHIDADTVSRMEATAARDAAGKKYTVSEYFREMFSRLGYEPMDASGFGGGYTATFRKAFLSGQRTELDEFGTAIEYSAEYVDGAFVRDVRLTADNPFNGVREKYDAVPQYQTATALAQLKNGWGAFDEYGEWHVSFPSVTDAFPYLKSIDPDGLLLKYAIAGSSRMESSGTSTRINDDTSRYEFARYFDDSDTRLVFEYKRPVVYGWYLVALGAGVITVAGFIIATRKKKPTPASAHKKTDTIVLPDVIELPEATHTEAIETTAQTETTGSTQTDDTAPQADETTEAVEGVPQTTETSETIVAAEAVENESQTTEPTASTETVENAPQPKKRKKRSAPSNKNNDKTTKR